MEIHLGLTKQIDTTIGQFQFEIMVEPKSGRINPQTGMVMDPNELQEILDNMVDRNDKLKIKAFKYLPQTMEMLASRVWEEVEEHMTHEARPSRIRITHGSGVFVVYDGRPEQWGLPPQVQPKKRRKKSRRKVNVQSS